MTNKVGENLATGEPIFAPGERNPADPEHSTVSPETAREIGMDMIAAAGAEVAKAAAERRAEQDRDRAARPLAPDAITSVPGITKE